MSSCAACGAPLPLGATFCNACGASAESAPAGAPGAGVALAVGALAAALAFRLTTHAVTIVALRAFSPLTPVFLALPVLVALALGVGLARRRRWARIAALVLGAVRAAGIVVSFLGFAYGGVRLAQALAVLELAALAVGAFALLRPGAAATWSR